MRLWAFLSQMVRRVAWGFATSSTVMLLGGDAVASYPGANALAAIAKFAWVRTCVFAIAGDAAALPLVAVRMVPGPGKGGLKREIVDDPALALLHHPSPGVTEYLFRKQTLVDYTPGGNAYWRVMGPTTIVRVPPNRVIPQGTCYFTTGFKVSDPTTGTEEIVPEYTRERGTGIIWLRDASWTDGNGPALGGSVIESLHDDLTIEFNSRKLASNQAANGKPEILLSSDQPLTSDIAKSMKEAYAASTRTNDKAFVTGLGVKATVLSWQPDFFKFAERSDQTRDVILASFEVPPARAGLGGANYGTQKQQMRTYWESVRSRMRVIDDALSLLAQPGVRIEHDFSGLEALQVSFSEQIEQASKMVSQLGATPAAACSFVGLDDAPVPDVTPEGLARPINIDQRPNEPQGDKALLTLSLHGYLEAAAPRYAMLAEAAEGGADVTLALRLEVERLFSAIDQWASQPAVARAWAEDVAATTLEGVRIAKDDDAALERLFSFSRAQRVAESIGRREAA